MTMILNKAPEPAPPAPRPVLDRPALEQAERTLLAIRFFMRTLLVLGVIGAAVAGMASPAQAGGVALLAILAAVPPWLLVEASIIAARACVATAWAARVPDGQP